MKVSRARTLLFTGRSDVVFDEQADYRCLLCCVDDTDDLEGDSSTGAVAEAIAEAFIECGAHIILGITRHQLLLSGEVAYTSHNSSMCFMALVLQTAIESCKARAVQLIETMSVEVADPGLCIAVLPIKWDAVHGELCIPSSNDPARKEIDQIVAFGKKAKVEVCTKQEAYGIAEQIEWLDLSEHGGGGEGIIGALAGVGLRLDGNDGRLRGKWDLKKLYGQDAPDDLVSIAEFTAHLVRQVIGRVQALDSQGNAVAEDVLMFLGSDAKPIMKEGALTFVVDIRDGIAYPCKKVDLGAIGNTNGWNRYCDKFEFDTDVEEQSGDETKRCGNCLYRRWTKQGFDCVVEPRKKGARRAVQET